MVRVHAFRSTAAAYDASQTSDEIKDGDVLVVESERVVGVMVEAWPVAVTRQSGEFHAPGPGWDWEKVAAQIGPSPRSYAASVSAANLAASALPQQ